MSDPSNLPKELQMGIWSSPESSKDRRKRLVAQRKAKEKAKNAADAKKSRRIQAKLDASIELGNREHKERQEKKQQARQKRDQERARQQKQTADMAKAVKKRTFNSKETRPGITERKGWFS